MISDSKCNKNILIAKNKDYSVVQQTLFSWSCYFAQHTICNTASQCRSKVNIFVIFQKTFHGLKQNEFDIANWYSFVIYYEFSMFSFEYDVEQPSSVANVLISAKLSVFVYMMCVRRSSVLTLLSSASAVLLTYRLHLGRKIPGCGREVSARLGSGGRWELRPLLQRARGSGGAAGVVLQRQSH